MPKKRSTAASSQQPAASSPAPCVVACRWQLLSQYLLGLGSGPDHEDDVQETLIALHARWSGFLPLDLDHLRRYAAKSLRRRRLYRVLRCRPMRDRPLGDAVFGLEASCHLEVQPLTADANPEAARLLGRLGFAVFAARVAGHPVGRIASMLGTSRSSVLRVIRRNRERAAEIFERTAEFGPDGTREALCLVKGQMLTEIDPQATGACGRGRSTLSRGDTC